MKLIMAYIKPFQLPKVTLALQKVEGLTGMSAVDFRGFGRSKAKKSKNFNGVAPDADLVTVRAFDSRGVGTYADVIRGLDWIVARPVAEVDLGRAIMDRLRRAAAT